MQLYSIGTNEYEADVEKLIKRRLTKKELTAIPIVSDCGRSGSFVTVGIDNEEERLVLSTAVAEILLEDIRYFEMADMAARLPFSLDEKGRILASALDSAGGLCDLSPVAAGIFDYLSSFSTLILEGYVRFRLQNVLELWSVCIDAAAQQQLLADEFRELTALVGLFAALKPGGNPALLIVLHPDGSCTIIEETAVGQGFRIDCAPECGSGVIDLIRGMEPSSIRIRDASFGRCEKLRAAIYGRFGALIKDGDR